VSFQAESYYQYSGTMIVVLLSISGFAVGGADVAEPSVMSSSTYVL
jgi:hypothetical protein